MSSFRKINYSLRPAKHAERKMLSEIMRRLSHFSPLEEYVYVGFGSVWFSDFILFHKSLGIRDMISIESASGAKDRFESNKPFNIKIIYKNSKLALQDLEWSRRQIIWLDYDGVFSPDMLADARTISTKARSGTLVALSVQCNQADEVGEAQTDPTGLSALARFTQRFGRERVAEGTQEEDLYSWNFGTLIRDMIRNEIDSGLSVRNAMGTDFFQFKPIASIDYQDGAKMTTIIGVIINNNEGNKFESCCFDLIDFLENKPQPIKINIPMLTPRELKHIERQLPINNIDDIFLSGGIPRSDARNFVRMYRYFPNFAVVDG